MSKSAIAWFEDVDSSLLTEIQKSVRYKDNKGNSLLLPEKNVIVRKPEEDYKIEVYPCVSIYNLNASVDRADYYPYARVEKVVNRDEKSISYRGSNIPFKFAYQLDFWAKYQSDMNEMTRSWLACHSIQFNLPILSDEGYSCNCVQDGNIVKVDKLENSDRVFHSVISYSIWVEIEDERVYTKSIVEGVTLNVRR